MEVVHTEIIATYPQGKLSDVFSVAECEGMNKSGAEGGLTPSAAILSAKQKLEPK
jgi:hypothetical protein